MKPELKNLVEAYLQQLRAATDPESFPQETIDKYQVTPLSPDGSDRLYYRITAPQTTSFIAADATGCGKKDKNSGRSQNNSFYLIQQHLNKLNFPVPGYLGDKAAGDDLYLLEDLGDITLHNFVKTQGWTDNTITCYRKVLQLLLKLQIDAAAGFSPDWAYAGGFYDFELIVTRELNYFLEAFVINYCRIELNPATKAGLAAEFKFLAATAMQAPADFFLFRDFQSKNLMLFQNKIFLIDFQGARLGPIYYDLASLINDPYTEMPLNLRQDLQKFYYDQLIIAPPAGTALPDPATFAFNFTLFSLIRTLQTLGAFGYLSGRGKIHFAQYIRPALANFTLYLESLKKQNSDCKLETLNLINQKIGLWQLQSCTK